MFLDIFRTKPCVPFSGVFMGDKGALFQAAHFREQQIFVGTFFLKTDLQ